MKKALIITIITLLLAGFISCNGNVDEKLWKNKEDAPENVTVTFVSNGGTSVDNQTILKGTCAEKPENPTFNSYTFSGWFLKNSATEFDFSTPVNESITLYAHWEGIVETKNTIESLDLSSDSQITVQISPVSSKDTTVSIPAGAISATGSHSSELAVTSYSIEISTAAFEISGSTNNNLAVAGIDCTLKIDDEIVSDFNAPIIVTTYIPKGLSSVEVVYNGVDDKAQPVANNSTPGSTVAEIFNSDTEMGDKLGYSKESGKLRFSTIHFSEFYVATNAEVYIVEDADPTNVSAMTLGEFRDIVNNGTNCKGFTVKVLKDCDYTNEDWIPIGIYSYDGGNLKPFGGNFDGNNKTIKLKNTNITAEENYEYFGFFAFILNLDADTAETPPIEIKNIILDVNFASDNQYMNIGGLSSQIHKNVDITNVKVKGSIDSTRVTGGLYGDANCDEDYNSQHITDCIVEANLKAHSVRNENNWLCIGGILGQSVVGEQEGVFVTNCKFTGIIETFFDENHNNGAQSYLGYVMGKGGSETPYDKTTIYNFTVGEGSSINGYQTAKGNGSLGESAGYPFEGFNKYNGENTYTGTPNPSKELLGGYFGKCTIDEVTSQGNYPHGGTE